MKRFTKIRSLMIAIALLLGAIPAAAIERPFALNGNGVGVFTLDETGFPVSADVTGSGTATHLGLWSTSGTVRFTRDENGVIRSSGEATITAANGDKIDMSVAGVLDPATGIDHAVFTFVGGTGRFAGVSGSANGVAVVNLLTGAFELTMVGKIDY
jgi:hypothetical protein